MNYVVKVGNYYVKSIDSSSMLEIKLSEIMMRRFQQSIAMEIAEKLNGEVIYIPDEITISEDKEK